MLLRWISIQGVYVSDDSTKKKIKKKNNIYIYWLRSNRAVKQDKTKKKKKCRAFLKEEIAVVVPVTVI